MSTQRSGGVASNDVVGRVRSRLMLFAWIRAVLVGAAVGIILWLVLGVLLRMYAPSAQWLSVVLSAVAAVVAVFIVQRRFGDLTRTRASLWIEEQFPELQFSLATLNEFDGDKSRSIAPDARERLLAAVGRPAVEGPIRARARKQLLAPAVVLLLIGISAVPLHARLKGDNDAGVAGTSKRGAIIRQPSSPRTEKALADWRVRIIPPPYTALETRSLGDIGLVSALVGSRIEVSGGDATAPSAIVKSVADTIEPVAPQIAVISGGWRAQIIMPAAAAEVRFALGANARQLLLEPRPDSTPVVQLKSPGRDSVYRVPKGMVVLSAEAHDDIGLANANFELIVTSGEGERFTARTVALALQHLNGEREHAWQASMLLDTMKLEPGDIVHMRAVARDRNPEKDRDAGASETRTFRIARPAEYDSVAVDPAPPPETQKSLMSQRMLLILTEKLEARRPTLSREVLVRESRALSAEQARLRKVVGDIVFVRLEGEDGAGEHSADEDKDKLVAAAASAAATGGPPLTEEGGDESPIINVNKPLLEAFNAMWSAGTHLDIADPKSAIPDMKLALLALERARGAERIYLRGKPPVVVIDVAKVRLAGKDTGEVNARAPRESLSPKQAMRETRLLAAALLMSRDVNAARDSLALLRLESLSDAPRLAAALGDALEVTRRGGNVTDALIRARRLLASSAPADTLSHWRGKQ